MVPPWVHRLVFHLDNIAAVPTPPRPVIPIQDHGYVLPLVLPLYHLAVVGGRAVRSIEEGDKRKPADQGEVCRCEEINSKQQQKLTEGSSELPGLSRGRSSYCPFAPAAQRTCELELIGGIDSKFRQRRQLKGALRVFWPFEPSPRSGSTLLPLSEGLVEVEVSRVVRRSAGGDSRWRPAECGFVRNDSRDRV